MTEFGHVDSRTDNITDLTFTEMESVNGGFVIVPFLIGLGKASGMEWQLAQAYTA